MNCDEALALMQQQLDAPLPEPQAAALQAHLASCAQFREIENQLRLTDEALQAAALDPPAQLHENVMRRIRAQAGQKKRRFWRTAAALAAAAALVLLAGYAGWITLPGFDDEAAVSVSIGAAAEQLLAQSKTPAALCSTLCEQTGCDVLLMEQCPTPDALQDESFEEVLSGARLYLVPRELADSLQASYAGAYCVRRFTPAQPQTDAAQVYLLLTP